MRICIDCNQENNDLDFNYKLRFCKKCQYLRYNDNVRSSIKIICPICLTEKFIKINSFLKLKTNICDKCI